MAPLGYIEILDGKGNVAERVPIESFPVRIGRAYTNEVIVSDPYVCPMHVEIAEDERGRLRASDLDSVNGLHQAGEEARVSKLELQSGSQFRIGRTWLRYCSVDHPIAPTAIDASQRIAPSTSTYAAIAAGALVLSVLCLESFISSVERVKLVNVVGEPLVTVVTTLGWAGAWALASRIIVSRFHFSEHTTIAFGAILGFILLSTISEWLEFFFPAIPVLWVAGLFGSGLVLAALVYSHLGFASPLRRRSRILAALLISAAVVCMNAISDYAARSKFSTVMEYTGVLKPIDAALLPSISIDRFIADSQKLRSDLDSLAQKARAAQP